MRVQTELDLKPVPTLLDKDGGERCSGATHHHSSEGRTHMKNLFLRLLNETEGQDLIEYALLAALIALAATGAMTLLGTGISNKFTTISSSLAS